jgi:pyruvate/2-oxoglutarate dehydrogenase complex dihydrolipoamide dehydrogenase (E3) component
VWISIERNARILGAHLVDPHADEVINLFGFSRNDGADIRWPRGLRHLQVAGAGGSKVIG